MRLIAALIAAILATPMAQAQGEAAGKFDYYVLSLGWSSNWCALEGDARRDRQCDKGRGLTWTLHGLWPQFEHGYPSYCRTGQSDPSRTATAQMADIMGGSGLAFYQWKKHGRCSGLSSHDYYGTMRTAYSSIAIPALFAKVSKDLTLPAAVIEGAFIDANPGLSRGAITVTCQSGMIQEVRICLDKSLARRNCGADVSRDCSLKDAELNAVR